MGISTSTNSTFQHQSYLHPHTAHELRSSLQVSQDKIVFENPCRLNVPQNSGFVPKQRESIKKEMILKHHQNAIEIMSLALSLFSSDRP